jgi:AbiJ N-terminal domain 3
VIILQSRKKTLPRGLESEYNTRTLDVKVDGMELVSKALRHNFREFCSTIPLRLIDDMFQNCDIQPGNISPGLRVSGERRTQVEQYYASLDWTDKTDAQRFLDVISFALMQDYVPPDYKDSLRQLCNKAGFHVEGDIISFPTNGQKIIPSNPPDRSMKQSEPPEAIITTLTRRDIIDELCKGRIEGRLDLVEFLKMTWPDLDSMPSPCSSASLSDDVSWHMINFSDWDYDFLLYQCLGLLECADETFLSFLASCIHPLVITDKKVVGELLSFFNEALRPDGYVFKLATYVSGKPVYKATKLNSDESEYIVPRAIEIIEQLARGFHLVVRRLGPLR